MGSRDRIANPELKGRGKVEMGAAASALAAGLKAFNGEEILFLASPRISNETAFLFASLAKQSGSRNVFAAEDLRRPSLPGRHRFHPEAGGRGAGRPHRQPWARTW